MTFLLVLLPFAGAADGARVFTAPCDAKDPAQQWTFDASAGQLSINQQCATLFGGTPSSDATIVLAPCASSDWRLQAPAHPVAAGSTWLVSTQSPQGLSWFIPIPQPPAPTTTTTCDLPSLPPDLIYTRQLTNVNAYMQSARLCLLYVKPPASDMGPGQPYVAIHD